MPEKKQARRLTQKGSVAKVARGDQTAPKGWTGLPWARPTCAILPAPFGLFACNRDVEYLCVPCGYVWICDDHYSEHRKDHKANGLK